VQYDLINILLCDGKFEYGDNYFLQEHDQVYPSDFKLWICQNIDKNNKRYIYFL